MLKTLEVGKHQGEGRSCGATGKDPGRAAGSSGKQLLSPQSVRGCRAPLPALPPHDLIVTEDAESVVCPKQGLPSACDKLRGGGETRSDQLFSGVPLKSSVKASCGNSLQRGGGESQAAWQASLKTRQQFEPPGSKSQGKPDRGESPPL